jgi:hypothetical protein
MKPFTSSKGKARSAGQQPLPAPAPKASSPSARGAAKSSPQASAKRGPAQRQGARQERKPGEPLANLRHEMFAQAYVVSGNASEAYRRAFENKANADVHAAGLIVNPSICERISELRAKTAQRVEKSREDIVDFLCQIVDERRVATKEQLKAAELLNKMCGWNEPEKVEQAMTIRIIE